MEDLRDSFSSLKVQLEKYDAEYESKRSAIADVEEMVRTLSSGTSAGGGLAVGYQSHLREIKQKIARCDLDINRCKVEIKYTSEQLREKLPHAEAAISRHNKSLNDLENIKKRINATNVRFYITLP